MLSLQGTFFRMQREEWKNYKNVQAEMDLVPAVTSIKEARLLLMQENSFGREIGRVPEGI